jgi:hypothetical protein
MKNIIINLFLFLFFLFISLIIILSTIGIETSKFNKLISEKASETNNIKLNLNTIKFKLDPKDVSLFLETQNPKINYKNIVIPVENIKVYIDFFSLLYSDPKIRKTNIFLKELDVINLNKLSSLIKPSNFKSFLKNKIKKGKLISEIEIFFNDDGSLKDFIAKGDVKDLQAELLSGLNLKKANFSFFSDENDILIKNIYGNVEDIKISNGDIKLNLENGIKLSSNFKSKINFDENLISKYSKFFGDYKFLNQIKMLQADLNNNFSIILDNTYKIKDYNYNFSGMIEESKFELFKPGLKYNDLFKEKIEDIFLKNIRIKQTFSNKNVITESSGKYSLNNKDFFDIGLKNTLKNKMLNLKLNFDFNNSFELDLINYTKPKENIATIDVEFEKNKNNTKINKLVYKENNNLIELDGFEFKDNKYSSFKKIAVKTANNNFTIKNDKKIIIKGTKFDAINLTKFFTNQTKKNQYENLNSDIEIDFKIIEVPMSEKLYNFKLIGEIKKGKFIKISSKGDFGGNNFLDITMRKDKNSVRKYLEIYSDLTRPLLADYNFFKGLSGGNLLFTSIIDGTKSNSKLKIENFKVINAPGFVRLLSMADLGGLADLTEGEGLSFDVLEIDLQKTKNVTKVNEILALGPSVSVLMDGYYQDKSGLTSLRGTLVPAKTLNKMISKIPVIGNIVIPKDAGEGLFGISFKMKGQKGKIKTTINPIRTLTPRFIQKIIDRKKSN